MASISVVILSHNRLGKLQNNLNELFRFSDLWNELHIVDNASTDGSQDFLASLRISKVQVLLQKRNLGVAAGRNLGLKQAKGNIILCLDDDAFIEPTLIGALVDAFENNPSLGVVAFRVIHGETGEPQNPHGDLRKVVANYHGAAHAFRREAIEKIGFLDEQCFFGGEELDSCIRLYDAGYYCVYFPDFVAMHYSFARLGKEGLERFLRWTFNYARILYKNFPENMAKHYANRILLGRLFNGLRRFGFSALLKIWDADRKGRNEGTKQHKQVSKRTIDFYANEDLRPEFGNVPLWKKAFGKLR
jgi:GT2 family glycosyltransferase